jgi:hypothetical protein
MTVDLAKLFASVPTGPVQALDAEYSEYVRRGFAPAVLAAEFRMQDAPISAQRRMAGDRPVLELKLAVAEQSLRIVRVQPDRRPGRT